jgi:HlyD family secretion protein
MGARLVAPASRLLLIAALLIVATCLVGSMLIRVPIKVQAQGLLMTTQGVRDAVAVSAGRVRDIRVRSGEHVIAGQVVADIEQLDLQQDIAQAQSELDDAGEQLERVRHFQARHNDQRETLNLELRQSSAQRKLAMLQQRLRRLGVLASPYSGTVAEFKLNEGEMIERGGALFSLLPDAPGGAATSLIATIYVDAAEGKNIRPGMRVELVPAGVKREEYGFIFGKVLSVAAMPATQEGMQRTLKNQKLVQTLSAAGAPLEVVVALEADAANASGLRWSSSRGPAAMLSPGSLCSAAVVTREETVFRLLVPAARRLLPGYSS